MKVDHKRHSTIIKNTQYDTAVFYEKLVHQYNSYKTQNLIIDLTHCKELLLQELKS